MAWKEISPFLARFRTLKPPRAAVRAAVIQGIRAETNIDIHKDEVEVRGAVAHLNVSPVFKNEIHIAKQRIMKRIHASLGSRRVADIR